MRGRLRRTRNGGGRRFAAAGRTAGTANHRGNVELQKREQMTTKNAETAVKELRALVLRLERALAEERELVIKAAVRAEQAQIALAAERKSKKPTNT